MDQNKKNISELDVLAQFENNTPDVDNDFLNLLNELESRKLHFEEELDHSKYNYYQKLKDFFVFLFKYISTSTLIFVMLMGIMNFSAYKSIALSYLDKETLEQNSMKLTQAINSANNINEKTNENIKTSTGTEVKKYSEKIIKEKIKKPELIDMDDIEANKTYHSMNKLLYKTNNEEINFNIDITPYENRVVIPKIGKNIPLVDVEGEGAKTFNELEGILMDELEKGIVRYPNSGIPGEKGNSFIFGHSSNFPWINSEYNDVFALLDKVVYDDEVIVYYGQNQYKYKIKEKKVIAPGDVSVIKGNDKDKSQITLMTCWPIGTTLNRLIVVGELIE